MLSACSGIPGITYSFNTETLEAFKRNFFFKNNISSESYYNFETITTGDIHVESDKMFPASYVIQTNYGHSLEKLCNIPYWPRKFLKCRDQTTTAQVKDVALRLIQQTLKVAILEMFCTELKFVTDCLYKFFEANIKVFHLKIPDLKKQIYEKENPKVGQIIVKSVFPSWYFYTWCINTCGWNNLFQFSHS